MHRKLSAIWIMGFLALSAPALHAQPSAEMCNAAFSQGIRDNYQLLTERQQFEFYQSRLCSAKFESYDSFRQTSESLNISLPIAEGLLGLGGSASDRAASFRQKYEAFCASNYFSSEYRERYQSYISQISSALLASWNECVRQHLKGWLDAKGVFAEVSPFGSFDSFVTNVRIRTNDVGQVVIKAIHPDEKVKCSRAGQPVQYGVTQIDSLEFTLTCYKDPNLVIPFVIETNRGQTQPIAVPAGTSKILEINDKIDAIRAELAKLRADAGVGDDALLNKINSEVATINGRLGAWKECSWRPVGYEKTHAQDASDWCPNGWYVTQLDFDAPGSLYIGQAKCCHF